MPQSVLIELEMPDDLMTFRLPQGLHHRLQELLDRQDEGKKLTAAEREEAEGLVDLTEMFAILKSRAQRAAQKQARGQ